MATPSFYNEQDQNIYDNVSKFMPQSKYLRSAPTFTAPTTEEEEITETFGIPNTNAFTNSGGDNYTGGYNFNNNGFQQAVDARQNRLNNPSDTFLGFNTMRDQQLTGADAGEYFGSGTAVPQEQTMMGKVQSGFQSTGKGITNLMGMLPTPSNLLNKFGIQNFSSLSPADQAFIQMNAGYTGPTIFGENTSGTSKDPFGRNVESIGGNYAQKVRDDFDKLSTNLSPTGVIGKKDQYQGATFDPVTGTFTADDEDEASIAAAAYANKMNKMNLSRYRFDKKAIAQQEQNQKDIEKAAGVRDTKAAQDFMRNNPNYGNAEANANTGSGGGKGYDSQADYSGSDKRSQDNRSSDLGFSDIRLKENVELIGKSPSNINIYKFNYKDNPTTYQGAMAHEVPWASIKHSNGYMMVDYNKIDVNFKKI